MLVSGQEGSVASGSVKAGVQPAIRVCKAGVQPAGLEATSPHKDCCGAQITADDIRVAYKRWCDQAMSREADSPIKVSVFIELTAGSGTLTAAV